MSPIHHDVLINILLCEHDKRENIQIIILMVIIIMRQHCQLAVTKNVASTLFIGFVSLRTPYFLPSYFYSVSDSVSHSNITRLPNSA